MQCCVHHSGFFAACVGSASGRNVHLSQEECHRVIQATHASQEDGRRNPQAAEHVASRSGRIKFTLAWGSYSPHEPKHQSAQLQALRLV